MGIKIRPEWQDKVNLPNFIGNPEAYNHCMCCHLSPDVFVCKNFDSIRNHVPADAIDEPVAVEHEPTMPKEDLIKMVTKSLREGARSGKCPKCGLRKYLTEDLKLKCECEMSEPELEKINSEIDGANEGQRLEICPKCRLVKYPTEDCECEMSMDRGVEFALISEAVLLILRLFMPAMKDAAANSENKIDDVLVNFLEILVK